MKKGFTLIEILIVVAIIAILASVVIIGLGSTSRAGRDARRIADLRQTQTALELYFNRCGRYPGQAAPAGGGVCQTGTPQNWDTLRATITGSGIGVNNVGADPQTAGGKSYGYFTNGTSYLISAPLEDPNNAALSQGITNFAAWQAANPNASGFGSSPAGQCGPQTPPTQALYCLSL
ncbi:MAG: prepilin-type N-terminal cleavage/methylation domain-containing protein [Patescibacteria group bacterium]